MLTKNQLEELLAEVFMTGAEFADIFISETHKNFIVCDDNKIEKIISGTDFGVGIRAIVGPEVFYECFTGLNFTELKKGCQRLVPARIPRLMRPPFKIGLEQKKHDLALKVERFPQEVSIDEKVAHVELANRVARAFGSMIKQVTVGYGDSVQNVWIANSAGEYVEDERVRTRFSVNVIAEKKGVLQTGYEAPGGFCGFELFKRYNVETLADKAANRAVKMLDAPHAPAGRMTVVLSSEAGGTMIHEACGHAFEADFILKKTSVFSDKLDKKVANAVVTVIDDATLSGNYGSYRFDDEGTPSQWTVLIENGIMNNVMADRYNAKLLGIKSTGNGRRESFRYKPTPRMSNTYIAPGKTHPEDIINSVKDGLLVKKMGGGQVDVVNGDFVFEVTEGYLIENGKIKYPVRGATLAGNGPRVLQIIDMVGTDLDFAAGVCGKYDHAPVSDGQPTIRIPEIVVGGR